VTFESTSYVTEQGWATFLQSRATRTVEYHAHSSKTL